MSSFEHLYTLSLSLARPLVRVAVPLSPKLRRGVEGRRVAVDVLERWAAEHRDPARPLVWLHAPSVGEALMAQAIAAAIRETSPSVQLAFTHFSPSAERMAGRVGADVAGYLPWDVPADMGRALRALRPSAVAFVRTEIWPVLTRLAQACGARVALVNAVLSSGSSRLRWPARGTLSRYYRMLDAVGAVTAEHGARFSELGVPSGRVCVTGDARFDQVWARVRGTSSTPLVERLRDPSVFTIVAGSTWPTDEAMLVPAFAALSRELPSRLIIAPHEPSDAHLQGVQRALDAEGVRHRRLAEVEADDAPIPDAVIVDRVGVLADLYSAADVAYVGGGFHRAGLHSVVEPAALGVPAVYGPRHGNAREGDELAAAGGGYIEADAAALTTRFRTLARDEGARRVAGEAARAYVESQLGGARRNAELILDLILDLMNRSGIAG
ncbi:MAG TPA: glycosyltransferase N-terminal domain-containing protein [Longimicrobiales bacterium]|nr:glycosyltransferase N-terminal domain-containing protein [Longimicrobiales bacterium]